MSFRVRCRTVAGADLGNALRVGAHVLRAADGDDAGQSRGHLVQRNAVHMRMEPEMARRMVGRDLDRVVDGTIRDIHVGVAVRGMAGRPSPARWGSGWRDCAVPRRRSRHRGHSVLRRDAARRSVRGCGGWSDCRSACGLSAICLASGIGGSLFTRRIFRASPGLSCSRTPPSGCALPVGQAFCTGLVRGQTSYTQASVVTLSVIVVGTAPATMHQVERTALTGEHGWIAQWGGGTCGSGERGQQQHAQSRRSQTYGVTYLSTSLQWYSSYVINVICHR